MSSVRGIGFGFARSATYVLSAGLVVVALAWVAQVVCVAILVGMLYGIPLGLVVAVFRGFPALLPAGLAWWFFDRARTAALDD